MQIAESKQTFPGVYEITPDEGSAFFLRARYLSLVSEDGLEAGFDFDEIMWADVVHASYVYSVEKLAMAYLARAEQCRAGLTAKLQKKGVPRKYIEQALDYLEECHFLDDARFASAWLRDRMINHAEGRGRLAAELASRGIERKQAACALDEFFSENDEQELCSRAYQKLLRIHRDANKIYTSLVRLGFKNREILAVIAKK